VIGIAVIIAVLFSPTINVLLVVLSVPSVIFGQIVFERSKRLEASTSASRIKRALPFLILMYCSFVLGLVFLFEGYTSVSLVLLVVTGLSLLPLSLYRFVIP
jgi:hypothetical protein